MAGVDGVGGAVQVTTQEVKAKAKQAVAEAMSQAAVQATPGDKFHSSFAPRGCSPPVAIPTRCPLPFPRSPQEEAHDLIDPVLNSSGAAQLEAYQRFTEDLKYASTAALKEALELIDKELQWTHFKFGIDPNRSVLELLRKNIQAELRTRPKEPKEEARELIDGVANKFGTKQLEAFVKFMSEIKNAGRSTLEEARDQLIDQMANESDREQRLIYKLMLHAVNKELDSRNEWIHGVPPIFNAVPAGSLRLSQEENKLLRSKLSSAGAATRLAINSFVGMKD